MVYVEYTKLETLLTKLFSVDWLICGRNEWIFMKLNYTKTVVSDSTACMEYTFFKLTVCLR